MEESTARVVGIITIVAIILMAVVTFSICKAKPESLVNECKQVVIESQFIHQWFFISLITNIYLPIELIGWYNWDVVFKYIGGYIWKES